MSLMDTSSTAKPASNADKRLACQSCQKRKTKCDRSFPCQTCQRAGTQCVAVVSQRLPRGRAGGRRKTDDNLKGRIGRLEALINTLQAQRNEPTGAPPTPEADILSGTAVPLGPTQYLGESFWTALGEELQGLGAALDEEGGDDDEDATEASVSDVSPVPDALFGGLALSDKPYDILQHPSPAAKTEMCAIFLRNFDQLFKVMHGPSLQAYLKNDLMYLDYEPGFLPVEALSFAVYFAAVSTITEDQCSICFGNSRTALVARYRLATEAALARADFINSEEIVTLQAFVIYLAILRFTDRSRRTWTLVSVAVRIAQALGLHTKTKVRDPFHAELRHRLWHQIRVLDLQLAVDRGADPLTLPGSFETLSPLNINDTDIYLGMHSPPTPRTGYTDMTFALMFHETAGLAVHMHIISVDHWQKRHDTILAFKHSLEDKYTKYLDPSDPFQRFVLEMARGSVAALYIHALRPTRLLPQTEAPAVNSETVLTAAVESLELSQRSHEIEAAQGWQWFIWVQWHALAMALAALCFLTQGELVERAWIVVDIACDHFEYVADAQTGELWRPIEKLAVKARKARAAALDARSGAPSFDLPGMAASGPQPTAVQTDVQLPDITNGDWLDWESFVEGFTDSRDLSDTSYQMPGSGGGGSRGLPYT